MPVTQTIDQFGQALSAAFDADWTRARCRTGDAVLTELFFSDEPLDINRAKAICQRCPLAEPCLAGALARAEHSGVWGGELFANGHVLTAKRRRGRPPKHPRPEPVVDECRPLSEVLSRIA
ncbi:MAG: WhiB family transcriptional regulator [Acidimicrobiales bacterium]